MSIWRSWQFGYADGVTGFRPQQPPSLLGAASATAGSAFRAPLLHGNLHAVRPAASEEKSKAGSSEPGLHRKSPIKALAQRAGLVHDDAAWPPLSGMPHKLKNNQHVRGMPSNFR
jgi:hypothetical protein